MEFLANLDTRLLLLINGLHNTFFDYFMIYMSARLIWIPLYLFLIYLIISQYKSKSYLIIGFLLLTVILSDQLSVHAFKNVFERLRPCHDPDVAPLLHLVTDCGGQYGFVSSHAFNVFALATFISFLLARVYRWIPWLMFIWAGIVSYSRIYLGVHYPGDVLAGAVLGFLDGWLMMSLYRYVSGLKKENSAIENH